MLSIDQYKQMLLSGDVLAERVRLELARLEIEHDPTEPLDMRIERMKKECPTMIVVSNTPSNPTGWCGPSYPASVFHNNKLSRVFAVSRDSTENPFKEGEDLYGENKECPPGVYYLSSNLWYLSEHYPHLENWLEFGDIPYGYTIAGPEGVRTEINFHPFVSKTQGCLTFASVLELTQFREELNRHEALDQGKVMVIIQDRYES